MARYIDAEVLKRKLIDEKNFFPAIVARALGETPTADVVKVVRCKDCAGAIKHKEYPDMYKCNGCSFVRGRLVTGEFGCTVGKRNGG